MKFNHTVHGECEVIDKNPITERTRSVLVRRLKDGANLYLSASHLPKPPPEIKEELTNS